MTVNDVKSIFILFSGVDDGGGEYNGLIQNSIDMLMSMLKTDADLSNPHLPYAAAAIANYRYTQTLRYYSGKNAQSFSSDTLYTTAGTIISEKISEKDIKVQYDHSKSLMLSYLGAIAPILRDDNFEIISVAS